MIYSDPDMRLCTIVLPRDQCQILWGNSTTLFLAMTEKAWEQLEWGHHYAGRFQSRYSELPFEHESVIPSLNPGANVLFTMIDRRLGGFRPDKYITWEIPTTSTLQKEEPFLMIRFRLAKNRMRILVHPLQSMTDVQ